jgi:hypothetical protein
MSAIVSVAGGEICTLLGVAAVALGGGVSAVEAVPTGGILIVSM